MARWQIFHKSQFVGYAADRKIEKSIPSIRGDITAKDGSTLAYSEPRFDTFVYLVEMEKAENRTDTRRELQTRREFVEKVSAVLEISEKELEDLLDSGPKWIKIAHRVDITKKEKLERIPREDVLDKLDDEFNIPEDDVKCILMNKNPYEKCTIEQSTIEKVINYVRQSISFPYLIGISFESTSQRIYPEGQLAAHVIGFLGKDLNSNDIGRGGIEQNYDGALTPHEGYIVGETDKFGNLITLSESISIEERRGSEVRTTIDKNIQALLEKKIAEGVERYQAKSGSAIVMNPNTGEIMAVANYPTYDPQEYYNAETNDQFFNRAVNEPFEIGSVAKVFVLSAGVEALGLKPDQVLLENGHQGCRKIQASNFDEKDVREICTFDKMPQPKMTVQDAMIKSDNLGFVKIGEMLGKETLYKYLNDFGVGKNSNVDLSGESFGYFPDLNDPNAWHPVDQAVFSYGHGYQMTLLQATRGVAAVANGGWLLTPFVVSEIREINGKFQDLKPVPVKKVIAKQTCDSVEHMMHELYKTHTNDGFKNLRNYPVAAKSGTALIPYTDRQGYTSDVNTTYIGFDTSEDSKFVMAIRLESPQAVKKLTHYSTRILWLETYNELKDYLGIKPIDE
jgi:cell division protein FtsI/penicillin-binding protein 2